MRTLARYVLLCGAAISIAWASVSVEIQGRTPYGHFLATGGDGWVQSARSAVSGTWAMAEGHWNDWMGGDDEAAPAKADDPAKRRHRRAKPDPKPTVQEESGAKRRVALLKAAQKEANVGPSKAPAKKTNVDAPMTKKDRAALDRLVAGR